MSESEQGKIAKSLSKVMEPGKKYVVDDLIQLFTYSDFSFSSESRTPVKSEPNRPRWNRWVRNALRGARGRSGSADWWPGLNAEFSESEGSVWLYWLEVEEGDAESTDSLLKTGVVSRPIQNDGWVAERMTQNWLESRGFEVFDVSREGCGFDLLARREGREIFIEVKSSTSFIDIVLTRKEWETAVKYPIKYKIAYFEHFNEEAVQEPRWIEEVASIKPTERASIEYHLPKDQWLNS